MDGKEGRRKGREGGRGRQTEGRDRLRIHIDLAW
jgi:hypothetical protein